MGSVSASADVGYENTPLSNCLLYQYFIKCPFSYSMQLSRSVHNGGSSWPRALLMTLFPSQC